MIAAPVRIICDQADGWICASCGTGPKIQHCGKRSTGDLSESLLRRGEEVQSRGGGRAKWLLMRQFFVTSETKENKKSISAGSHRKNENVSKQDATKQPGTTAAGLERNHLKRLPYNREND